MSPSARHQWLKAQAQQDAHFAASRLPICAPGGGDIVANLIAELEQAIIHRQWQTCHRWLDDGDHEDKPKLCLVFLLTRPRALNGDERGLLIRELTSKVRHKLLAIDDPIACVFSPGLGQRDIEFECLKLVTLAAEDTVITYPRPQRIREAESCCVIL